MMRFIICGTLLPPEVEQILPGASPAAGKYLRNMKKALLKQGLDVVEMSYVAIPGAKEAFEKANMSDDDIIYKDKTIIKSMRRYQDKVLKSLRDDDVVVFYNIVYFDFGLIAKIKKRGNKAILILADFTESYKENGNIVRWLMAQKAAREFKKFDYGIALSEKAREYYNSKAKVIVMEGGIDYCCYKGIQPPRKQDKTRVMYAGTLSYVTGVDILLSVINGLKNPDMEFYISGKGELECCVIEAAKNDSRIKYLGFVSDDEYYKLLESVDIFVNPRNMLLPQNKNNFPSKVLEYLATGRTVISTRFPGYDKFTDNFIFYDGDAEGLKKAIIDSRSISGQFYEKNRIKAAGFDWDNQVLRIIKLIRSKDK